jgi:hypothetical protein
MLLTNILSLRDGASTLRLFFFIFAKIKNIADERSSRCQLFLGQTSFVIGKQLLLLYALFVCFICMLYAGKSFCAD